jgi:hypothetical protein
MDTSGTLLTTPLMSPILTANCRASILLRSYGLAGWCHTRPVFPEDARDTSEMWTTQKTTRTCKTSRNVATKYGKTGGWNRRYVRRRYAMVLPTSPRWMSWLFTFRGDVEGYSQILSLPFSYTGTSQRRQGRRPALWNRSFFLRFQFRLLKSYCSGSDFWKIKVPIPVPTCEKLRFRSRFRFQLHISKKMFNEGNQMQNFISGSGSGTVP